LAWSFHVYEQVEAASDADKRAPVIAVEEVQAISP
jgi:hypothetical protein